MRPEKPSSLQDAIRACALCAPRFAATRSAHAPRPVAWFDRRARILIAGQAPGLKVHNSGRPFSDPSGVRLRAWLGLDEAVFYDRTRIAIVPMAFCFPGYSDKGSDLPPPAICAQTWRDRVMSELDAIQLTIIIGGYAMSYHLGKKSGVTEAVAAWRDRGDDTFVLPHPSWRNSGWLKRNPWYESDVVPRLQRRIKEVLND